MTARSSFRTRATSRTATASRSREESTGRTSPGRSLPVEFEEIGGETELADGVTAFELPGHFPGHMGLRIESDGRRAVLIADAAVNPMLLDVPDAVYVSDGDPAACAADAAGARRRSSSTRTSSPSAATIRRGGIGRVVTRDGRIVWEAA